MDVLLFSHYGASGQNQALQSTALCLEEFARWRYELDVRQLQGLAEFMRMWHQGRRLLSTIALSSLVNYCEVRRNQ